MNNVESSILKHQALDIATSKLLTVAILVKKALKLEVVIAKVDIYVLVEVRHGD